MIVDRDTTLCISIAARPSNIGAAVHSAGYAALGLNFIYCPRRPTDLRSAIAGVRALGIRGCSVSMPFKRDVVPFLDMLSDEARTVAAVNTIVNDAGVLTGYNTDVDSVAWALTRHGATGRRALVLGAGGMARACITAVRQAGMESVIACRSAAAIADLQVTTEPWASREHVPADVLINATPVGMTPDDASMPIPAEDLDRFTLVIDAVAMPAETRLIREARSRGIPVVTGQDLALRQAMRQFTLYTGVAAPEAAMAAALTRVVGTVA